MVGIRDVPIIHIGKHNNVVVAYKEKKYVETIIVEERIRYIDRRKHDKPRQNVKIIRKPVVLKSADDSSEYLSSSSGRGSDSDCSQRMESPLHRMTATPPKASPTMFTKSYQRDIYSGTYSSKGSGMSGTSLTMNIRENREREKREMAHLNDRLASYIEKVRFLEAQNKKMETDLFAMKNRLGSGTEHIRIFCEDKLSTSEKSIKYSNDNRKKLEDEIVNLMPQLAKLREKLENANADHKTFLESADTLLKTLSSLEAEINYYKRKIELIETEIADMKKKNQKILADLNNTRKNKDKEMLSRIDFQNQVSVLLDECQSIYSKQSNTMTDLLVQAHRDTTPENREYFKKELAAAIQEVRDEYELITNAARTDIESWYKLKIKEIQTYTKSSAIEQTSARDEITKHQKILKELRYRLCDVESRNHVLEKEIQDLTYMIDDEHRMFEAAISERDSNIRTLQDECQTLLLELQMLLDTKTTLDAEIAIYRKMLEGEENRAGLRQLVEQVVRTDYLSKDHLIDTTLIRTSETSSRTNVQRSFQGNIQFSERSPDGHYIVLHNNNQMKDVDMNKWKIKIIDKTIENVYVFPKTFVLNANQSVKIYARGRGLHLPPASLVYDDDEHWGTSANIQLILYDKEDKEKAKLAFEKSAN
ncbi:unnamed protein product [Auanema sp. JU1783]|nr:unnamed protein product [Auanema sp. JU1783]